MPIIRSILDNDLYKFTQQQAVLLKYPNTQVHYEFNNRRPSDTFNNNFLADLGKSINSMEELTLLPDEREFLEKKCPYLKRSYLEYLQNFSFNPKEVSFWLTDNTLHLEIDGTWDSTILWEVPLMAIISELYFTHVKNDWRPGNFERAQRSQFQQKADILKDVTFSDFGTRRRRSYEVQDWCVREFQYLPNFTGTSNVHLAHKYNVRPIGTMAHEWIMGTSALVGLRHANKFGLQAWNDVYQGDLGIALTDTFGSDAFFADFDGVTARLFDGVRHDSGDPLVFAEKAIARYQYLNIDPMSKVAVFSDGLTPHDCVKIAEALAGRINVRFGIGTNLTNDIPGSPALNMVIKLLRVNGIYVVKLSDVPTKAIGDRDALRVARWTFLNQPLDLGI